MNLERVNLVLQAASSLAVLVGMVFLILELNQNTTALQVSSVWAEVDAIANLSANIVNTPDLAEAMIEPESMDPILDMKLFFHFRQWAEVVGARYYLYQAGVLPEDQWTRHRDSFRSFLKENQVYRRYWEDLYTSGLLREGLYEDIASPAR